MAQGEVRGIAKNHSGKESLGVPSPLPSSWTPTGRLPDALRTELGSPTRSGWDDSPEALGEVGCAPEKGGCQGAPEFLGVLYVRCMSLTNVGMRVHRCVHVCAWGVLLVQGCVHMPSCSVLVLFLTLCVAKQTFGAGCWFVRRVQS